jgi:hypothetical protein
MFGGCNLHSLLKDSMVVATNVKVALEMLQTIHIKFSTFGYDLCDNVDAINGVMDRI